MSWSVNAGPSFNVQRPGSSYQQLTGFTQRFMLTQDSTLLTPGKAEPHQKPETMKGTFKLRGKTKMKKRPERCKNLVMPNLKTESIYGGFGKSKPGLAAFLKVSKKKSKKGKKKNKRVA